MPSIGLQKLGLSTTFLFPVPQMQRVQVGNFFFDNDPSNLLGSGSFASVYKGYSLDKKVPVAIKVIEYDQRSEFEKRYLSQEVRLMKSISHPNIILLRESKVFLLVLFPDILQKVKSSIYLVLEVNNTSTFL